MKTIKTKETLEKELVKGCVLRIYDLETIKLVNPNGEEVANVEYYIAFAFNTMEERKRVRECFAKGCEYVTLCTFARLEKILKEREERKAEQKRLEQETKELESAIEYFKGFYEGDNITITADFINNVEAIVEYIQKQKDIQLAKKNKISNVNDIFRVNQTKTYEYPLRDGYYLWLEKLDKINVLVELHYKNNGNDTYTFINIEDINTRTLVKDLNRKAEELIKRLGA